MRSFREFLAERYGELLGDPEDADFKTTSARILRLCDATADYIDEIVAPAAEKAVYPLVVVPEDRRRAAEEAKKSHGKPPPISDFGHRTG